MTKRKRAVRRVRASPKPRSPLNLSLRALADTLDREASKLVQSLPRPYPRSETAIAIAFAHRGPRALARSSHALKGPSYAASRAILRAPEELPVTIAWIWVRPELHKELWEAEWARLQVSLYGVLPGTSAGDLIEAESIATPVVGTFELPILPRFLRMWLTL